jgi:DNA-binding XRE family transcriptional regulator
VARFIPLKYAATHGFFFLASWLSLRVWASAVKPLHDREHFLLRVKQMRRSRNLSQVQLGRLAGVSPNTIQRIEKGKRETKESTVQALRRALTGSPAEKAAALSASSQYR